MHALIFMLSFALFLMIKKRQSNSRNGNTNSPTSRAQLQKLSTMTPTSSWGQLVMDLYPPGSSSRYSFEPLTIEKFFLLEAKMSLEVAEGVFVLVLLYLPHSNMFNVHHCLLGIGLALTAGLFRYYFTLKCYMFSNFYKQVVIAIVVLCTN